MYEINANLDLDLDIKYTYHKGRKASYDEPEELPEVEIASVKIGKTEILHELTEEQYEELETYVLENHGD